MMKLVISIDEFKKPLGQIDPNLDHGAQVMEALTDNLYDFLEDQLDWDIDASFNMEKADWDFVNNEVHIPMYKFGSES